MVDNTLAMQVNQLDLATPLAKAALINQANVQAQAEAFKYKQDVLGSEARGLTPYVNTQEFPQKWAETTDRLHQQGILDDQTHQQWRNTPSPLMLKSIISQTQPQSEEMRNLAAAGIDPSSPEGKSALFPKIAEDAETARHNKAEENKPVAVASGSILARPSGEVVAQNSAGQLDDATATSMAKQALSGDTSVFTNLGRGNQGAQNLVVLRKKMNELMLDAGMQPEEIALKNAQFKGLMASERTLGTRSANLSVNALEAEKLAPIAMNLSDQVDRTQFPTLNSMDLAVKKGVGSESVVRMMAGTNALVNTYAKAINPQGVLTDDARKQAFSILENAYSKGQYKAAANQMLVEIRTILQAPDEAKDALADSFLKTHGVKSAPQQETNANNSHANDPIAQAKDAINRGADKNAVIKRLQEKGIDPSALGAN